MFSAFEWMVAGRYLRARRQEGFVSVIAGFSFLGIALGVAALIIVMAVMNGFRHELLSRILGVNGHITVYGIDGELAAEAVHQVSVSAHIDAPEHYSFTFTQIKGELRSIATRASAAGAAARTCGLA